MQELWFLHSARRLMLIYIYLKFRKDRLNAFQVIERTRFRDRQIETGARGKTICLPTLKRGDMNIMWIPHLILTYVEQQGNPTSKSWS